MSYIEVKRNTDSAEASLIAVSKTKPNSSIIELYEKGHRSFGENRVQELVQKQKELPKDIQWHLIGSLQSNKVKHIASFVHLIHSVDSLKLAHVIIKEAEKANRCIDILIQVKIALEVTKQGINAQNAEDFVNNLKDLNSPFIRIRGLMAMASFTSNMEIVRKEFETAKSLFDSIQSSFCENDTVFDTLSMGMSGDYLLALECGSNMVRIGSLIFGSR
tara:strand:- start:998 stop:1651 length:654 start_codon:yes stop_codon:yes gene_type:complete